MNLTLFSDTSLVSLRKASSTEAVNSKKLRLINSLTGAHLYLRLQSWEQHAPSSDSLPTTLKLRLKANQKLNSVLQVLNGQLADKQYLVGNQVTVADIAVVYNLNLYYRYVADETVRNTIPNVTKYVTALASQEQFTSVVGRFITAKTTFPPYTGPLPQPEEAKKAEPKPKAPAAPKKEAAAPKKKAAKEEDDDDDEPKQIKEKNALDSLPPSPFNLFDFKTLIVNAPDKKVATETFLQQFDPQGYSVWRMEYEKAEGEGNVLFLTSNLMNGFLQRLETFRKYSFGVVGVYGNEPDLQIRGCWVWRGTEIPFEIKDHPSGEWYKFRKLDVLNNAEDKQLLFDYWSKMNEDEDEVEGLKARDIKYFK